MIRLRAAQFREDAGPLAHPVRPEEYIEINNFYTATVYEKGAEVIGMLRRLVGPETYARALDLYFERHDGQACTIEDWLAVFEDASGRDLAQFKRWYSQAGTPRLTATEHWDGAPLRASTSRQETPPTPGQPDKAPLVDPGRLRPARRATAPTVAEGVLELDRAAAHPSTGTLPARPVPSLLRGFSAPVILERATIARRARLPARPRQRPLQQVGGRPRLRARRSSRASPPTPTPTSTPTISPRSPPSPTTPRLDPAFKALALGLPSEDEIIAAHRRRRRRARSAARSARARRAPRGRRGRRRSATGCGALRRATPSPGPYSPDADAAGHRALRARALGLPHRARPGGDRRARAQFDAADNMTERMTALASSSPTARPRRRSPPSTPTGATTGWSIDKWFAVQAALTPPDAAVATVRGADPPPGLRLAEPQPLPRRSIGSFATGNPAGFHAADGGGYPLVVDWLIRLDPVNPQTTARLAASLRHLAACSTPPARR